jgi:hypothetical protein
LLFQKMGYAVQMTKASGDQGADLIDFIRNRDLTRFVVHDWIEGVSSPVCLVDFVEYSAVTLFGFTG